MTTQNPLATAIVSLGLLASPVAYGLYTHSPTSESTFYAQNKSNPFTVKDLATIVQVSRNNDVRFDQLYKGHYFTGTGTFKSASSPIGIGTIMRVSFSWSAPDVFCARHSVQDSEAVHWTNNTKLQVEGTIRETTMGDVGLMSDCRFTKVP